MNQALISMIKDEEFEVPLPDFPTGGTLINSEAVKEALEAGKGASCKIQAKLEYDSKEHMIIVREMPYATYTNTITEELEGLIEDTESSIDTFLDISGEEPNIRIHLKKGATPSLAMQELYSKTSLQNTFGINLQMLKDGRQPQLFSLREAMQEFLIHQRIVLENGLNFERNKLLARIHILNAYFIIHEDIEAVVKLIKRSADRASAKQNLMNAYPLDDIQADAVLKLTLARISSLEISKFTEEKEKALLRVGEIEAILASEQLKNEEIIDRLTEVMNKFGDSRRTHLINIDESARSKMYYLSADGRMGFSSPKDSKLIATYPAGEKLIAVTKGGLILRTTEQPKRMKKVFGVPIKDEILSIFIDDEDSFLTLINKDRNFRCIAINGLNASRTTAPISEIKEAYITKERTRKDTYRSQVKG